MDLFEPSDPEFSKAMAKAVRYLSIRPRSSFEMAEYLRAKGFKTDSVDSVIKTLEQDRYLDDRAFAKMFIDSRLRNNPKSKFTLKLELKKKGIAQPIVDDSTEDLDDLKLALSAVNRKMTSWAKIQDKESVKKKFFNYLSYRGFGYDVALEIWHRFVSLQDNSLSKF